MDSFVEYLWYLLTYPFKQVKKSVNSWYLLCRVLGRRLDGAKEELLRARDEGMVATCSEELLEIHAADRGLSRYEGETAENFRVRIANYEEVCRLGGSNEGVRLAVESLGYQEVQILSAPEWTGETERWAEFYVIVTLPVDDNHPTSFEILKRDVRATKEVGAKDCYVTRWVALPENPCKICLETAAGVVGRMETLHKLLYASGPKAAVLHQTDTSGRLIIKRNMWYFDGTYRFDGTKKFASGSITEVAI